MKNGGIVTDSKGGFSKAKIASILLGLGGACYFVAEYLTTGNIDPTKITVILTALGIYGVRDAQK